MLVLLLLVLLVLLLLIVVVLVVAVEPVVALPVHTRSMRCAEAEGRCSAASIDPECDCAAESVGSIEYIAAARPVWRLTKTVEIKPVVKTM